MSNHKRKLLVAILTAVVISFSAYVYNVVLKRDDFRTVDLITVIFTLLAIIKDIQLIYQEVKHNGK